MKVPAQWFGFLAALPVAAWFAIGLYAQQGISAQGVEQAPGDAKKALSLRALVEANQHVQLYSRVAGLVKTVAAETGSQVRRGQVLVQLDVPELEGERKLKMAHVDLARAEINQARSSLRVAQAALQSAKAQTLEIEAAVKSAAANLELRKTQFNRMQRLWEAKSVSQTEIEEERGKLQGAQATQDAGEAKLQSARAALEESSAKLGRAEADVIVAEARLAVANVGLERAQAVLQSSQILAPFDGVVTSRGVDVGAFAQAAGQGNARSLMTVGRTDVVRIVVQVPEREIAKFAIGAAATIQIDALPGKQFEGKLSRLAPTLDPQTATLRAEIDLRNDGLLLPGMSCIVTFKAGQ